MKAAQQKLLAAVCLALPMWAQAQAIGDWRIGNLDAGAGMYAATVNETQSVLGQFCQVEGDDFPCYWLLSIDIDCEPGESYIVLVNADHSAVPLEMLCAPLARANRYAFRDFDTIDSIVRSSTRIGIAFPMQSGQFQVSRFSLDGAGQAVDSMRSEVIKEVPPVKGSRGQQS